MSGWRQRFGSTLNLNFHHVPRLTTVPLLVAGLALGACSSQTASSSASERLPFDLACDASDTDDSSTLFCVRVDTRTGDTRLVNLTKLPVSNGPTASATKGADAYKVVCRSTSTASRSDFRCLRIDRTNGDVMMIQLPKIPGFPATK